MAVGAVDHLKTYINDICPGNLTLFGSVSNLIVCERAKRHGVHVTFGTFCKFGVWSTLITTALGQALLSLMWAPLES